MVGSGWQAADGRHAQVGRGCSRQGDSAGSGRNRGAGRAPGGGQRQPPCSVSLDVQTALTVLGNRSGIASVCGTATTNRRVATWRRRWRRPFVGVCGDLEASDATRRQGFAAGTQVFLAGTICDFARNFDAGGHNDIKTTTLALRWSTIATHCTCATHSVGCMASKPTDKLYDYLLGRPHVGRPHIAGFFYRIETPKIARNVLYHLPHRVPGLDASATCMSCVRVVYKSYRSSAEYIVKNNV